MINKKKTLKKILVASLIIILFIFLYSLKPLQSVVLKSYTAFKNSLNFRQTSELKEELAKSTIDEAKIYALEEENKKLREFLDFSQTHDLNLVLSNVIARQSFLGINSQEQNLIIDKGKKDGLQEGLAVLSELGSVIGKIVEVKESSALVCLLNNRNCQLALGILNEDKTLGLSEGEKGLSISMNLIPQTEEIEINDIVVSSGLDNLVPRNLIVGRIYQIEKKSNDIWQSALIEPVIRFDDLSILAIVLP
jgi:rod shape-determining protein MreC